MICWRKLLQVETRTIVEEKHGYALALSLCASGNIKKKQKKHMSQNNSHHQQGRLTLGSNQSESIFRSGTLVANEIMLEQLVQMGFDRSQAEAALKATGNKSIDVAIDYMSTNPFATTGGDIMYTSEGFEEPLSLSSSSYDSFTATEVKRTADLLANARRGLKGESLEAKLAFEERQRQMEAEKLRRQKQEEKKRLKQLRSMLKEEKEARIREQEERRKKYEEHLAQGNVVRTSDYSLSDPIAPVKVQESSKLSIASTNKIPIASASKSSDSGTSNVRDCTIQIRLPDGKTLVTTIASDKTLQEVYDFVHNNVEEFREQFSLITPFPRKEYNPQEIALDTISLSQAGLVPRGSLIVQKLKSKGKIIRSGAEQMMDDDDTNPLSTTSVTGGSSSSNTALNEDFMLEDSDIVRAHTHILTMKGPWLQVPEEESEVTSSQVLIFRPKSWVDQNCEQKRRSAINFIGQNMISESRIDSSNGIVTSSSGTYKIRYNPAKKNTELTLSIRSEATRVYDVVSLTDEVLILSSRN